MEEIRGKTLKEWKEYCKSDNVPIKTMKYIVCLEERIEALTIPVVVGRSEQLFCGDLIKHNFSLSKIGRCIICDREKDKAK